MNGLNIISLLAIALFASIILAIIDAVISSRASTRKTAIKLREALIHRDAFIGQDLDYFLDRLGIYTFFGSMDRGLDVGDWQAEDVQVEAWFQNGICVSFGEREK